MTWRGISAGPSAAEETGAAGGDDTEEGKAEEGLGFSGLRV